MPPGSTGRICFAPTTPLESCAGTTPDPVLSSADDIGTYVDAPIAAHASVSITISSVKGDRERELVRIALGDIRDVDLTGFNTGGISRSSLGGPGRYVERASVDGRLIAEGTFTLAEP